jgi:antitoxin component of MazEF toxin-antitoxin module
MEASMQKNTDELWGTITVRKWGNSLGIYIPKFVAQHLNIHAGPTLKMMYRENTIELTTGPTDEEKLRMYINRLLLENKQIAQGKIPHDVY